MNIRFYAFDTTPEGAFSEFSFIGGVEIDPEGNELRSLDWEDFEKETVREGNRDYDRYYDTLSLTFKDGE